MPELPEKASPRAVAAVGAAFELQGMIADKIAAIREPSGEQIADDAVNGVMRDFGDMFRFVSDAVGEVETPGGGEPDGERDGEDGEGDGLNAEDDNDDDDREGDGE